MSYLEVRGIKPKVVKILGGQPVYGWGGGGEIITF